MKKGRGVLRTLLLTLIGLSALFVLALRYAYQVPELGDETGLARIYRFADAGQIIEATLLDQDALVVGRSCSVPLNQSSPPAAGAPPPAPAAPTANPEGCTGQIQRFQASYPSSDVSTQELINRISSSGGELSVDKQTNKAVAKLLVTFLFPLVILANLFGIIFVSRSAESSIADIVGFGKIGRSRKAKGKAAGTEVTFANVAGADEAIAEMREVIDYLQDPKKFQEYGAAAPKGVLLFGPPGCGKTLLARAVAGESGVPFFSISGAEFVESLVGVGAARVRDLFAQIRDAAPAIVFIDEIDAVGRRREGEGVSGGEREQTVNQLLVEMDGFEVSEGLVVMAATNRPDILDPALLRPGRFDRHVTLETPDLHGRRAILDLHVKRKPLSPDVDMGAIARRTSGFTGADLANVINEAALLAIRDGDGTRINQNHLSEAVQRVMHGPQRRGRLMTPEERERIAFHESGHALVAAGLGRQSEAPRVSIVARGKGLGQSMLSNENERVLLTRSEMEAELAIAMAGIAAEELMFGESSTTSEDDIEKASTLAREMAGRYGMSPELGRIQLLVAGGGYLGVETSVVDSVSGHTMQEMDAEIKRLVSTAEAAATDILSRHRQHLEKLAERLVAQETLEGPVLENMLQPVRPDAYPFSGAGRLPGRR